jgi:hypothetical protein
VLLRARTSIAKYAIVRIGRPPFGVFGFSLNFAFYTPGSSVFHLTGEFMIQPLMQIEMVDRSSASGGLQKNSNRRSFAKCKIDQFYI